MDDRSIPVSQFLFACVSSVLATTTRRPFSTGCSRTTISKARPRTTFRNSLPAFGWSPAAIGPGWRLWKTSRSLRTFRCISMCSWLTIEGRRVCSGSFATDRCAPKIARCPLFPESDAKLEPWHLSRRVTATVAVSPCNVPLWLCGLPFITGATLAFERGFPAITFEVHLQDRGMVHEPVDSRQRHGLVGKNLIPFAEGL